MDNPSPSRPASYAMLSGLILLGWTLALLPQFHLPEIKGWWILLAVLIGMLLTLLAAFFVFLMMSKMDRWEGAITSFLNRDIERIANVCPFPQVFRKVLYGIVFALFLPWLFAIARIGAD